MENSENNKRDLFTKIGVLAENKSINIFAAKFANPQDEINKAIYGKAFFAFGLLPILYLLRKYEQDENFEECQGIKWAIENINNVHQENLPTRWGKKALDFVRNIYLKEGDDFEAYLKKVPTDAENVVNLVNAMRQDYGLNQLTDTLKKVFKY